MHMAERAQEDIYENISMNLHSSNTKLGGDDGTAFAEEAECNIVTKIKEKYKSQFPEHQ